MTRLGAVILRGFRLATTYKLNFLGRQLVWVCVVVWVHFMGKLFGHSPGVTELLGTDYFTYTLVGIIFQQFLMSFLMSFANNMREEMLMGTLEPLLATSSNHRTVLLGGSIYNFMEATWTATMMFGLGLLFGADFSRINLPGVVLFVVLGLAGLAAWGIVSASFVMAFKKADPVTWGMYSLSYLLSGVYFPITELPGWLQPACYLLPLTYAIHGVRGTLIDGQGLWEMRWHVLALVGYAAVLTPLALWCFRRAVARARRTGSLLHY